MVGGFHVKFALKLTNPPAFEKRRLRPFSPKVTHPFNKGRFRQSFARSAAAVTGSQKMFNCDL